MDFLFFVYFLKDIVHESPSTIKLCIIHIHNSNLRTNHIHTNYIQEKSILRGPSLIIYVIFAP